MALTPTRGAQANPFLGGFFGGNDTPFNNSNTLLSVGLGLLSGGTPQQQVAQAASNFVNERQQGRTFNKTIQALRSGGATDLADAVESGAIPAGDAYSLFFKQKLAAEKPQSSLSFETLPDGSYGSFNRATGEFAPIGKVAGPAKQDEYGQRAAAASNLGLTPDDPRYQPYVLTGQIPKESQNPLTATDKKAILDSDEAVASNESAIGLLDQALAINNQANSGWTAGARAAIGNNLPDILVPDAVSSPESSQATADYDNIVQQQALGQLRAIFGGNPTEGERSILLELQGSSSKPPKVREGILQRAKSLAQRRLDFNKSKANELRGGSYYKPGGGSGAQPQSPAGNKTSSGVSWSVEP